MPSLLTELPVASNCNILLADPNGSMAVVECTPERKRVRPPKRYGSDYIVCTVNSFTSDEMKPYDDAGGDDYHSLERYQVVTDSFTHHIKADYIENTTRLLKESTALCVSTTMNPTSKLSGAPYST